MQNLKADTAIVCTICNSINHELVGHARTPRIFSLKIPISICRDCGFVFINPRWEERQYEQVMDLCPYEFVVDSPSNSDESKWFKRWYVLDKRVYPYYSDGIHNLLDIGAGRGWCIEYVKRQFPNINAFAIERWEECQKHIENEYGGKIIADHIDADWDQTYENSFDLVVFRRVLEHLLNPEVVLKKIRKSLTDTGYVYISVPSMRLIKSNLFYDYFRPVHLSYFCKETLESLARKAGLEPVILQEKEEGELWGMFKKGEIQNTKPNVYQEMKEIIQHFKRKERGLMIQTWLRMNLIHYLERMNLRKPLAQLRRKFRAVFSQ